MLSMRTVFESHLAQLKQVNERITVFIINTVLHKMWSHMLKASG